jgi:hypothetical protein
MRLMQCDRLPARLMLRALNIGWFSIVSSLALRPLAVGFARSVAVRLTSAELIDAATKSVKAHFSADSAKRAAPERPESPRRPRPESFRRCAPADFDRRTDRTSRGAATTGWKRRVT